MAFVNDGQPMTLAELYDHKAYVMGLIREFEFMDRVTTQDEKVLVAQRVIDTMPAVSETAVDMVLRFAKEKEKLNAVIAAGSEYVDGQVDTNERDAPISNR
jgi:predicted ribonuclease toxin of YeeF-YezG toxin-antitoxin module